MSMVFSDKKINFVVNILSRSRLWKSKVNVLRKGPAVPVMVLWRSGCVVGRDVLPAETDWCFNKVFLLRLN